MKKNLFKRNILITVLLLSCAAGRDFKLVSKSQYFEVKGQSLFKEKISDRTFKPFAFSQVDCSFYAAGGSLWGPLKSPPIFNTQISKNQFNLRFSTDQLLHEYQLGSYVPMATIDEGIQVNPPKARLSRFIHFCEGFATTFIDKITGEIAMIVYAEEPLTIRGKALLDDGKFTEIDVNISTPGYNVLAFTTSAQGKILKTVNRYELIFTLARGL